MNRKILFVSGIGLIVLAFVAATLLYQNQSNNGQPGAPQGSSAGSERGVLERTGAPIKGPADAKVTIVEFFDPACGTCGQFYPLVNQLIEQYPGQVRVMMRYAPLHTGSDQVVKMLEAAHRQGKFFPALELLFRNQNRWVANHVSQPMRALGILRGLALDHDRLAADLNNLGVISAVQEDVQEGQALGVKATPEFFVNGRPLPSFGYEQLRQLVSEAVEESY